MLHLKTLGGLALGGDRLPASASQPRRLAFLALLARGPDLAQGRDFLMAVLWPESPAERARHALDQLLYSTRRDLGRDVVLTEAARLRLNPHRVAADCSMLDGALDENRREQAVELYSGPFLDAVHFSDAPELERWVERERAAIAARISAAAHGLARAADGCGDTAGSMRWWRQVAELDPFSSVAAAQFISALERSQDLAAALHHGRKYAALVRDELGVEPDTAVTELLDRIAVAMSRPPVAPPASAECQQEVPPDEVAPLTTGAVTVPAEGMGAPLGLPLNAPPAWRQQSRMLLAAVVALGALSLSLGMGLGGSAAEPAAGVVAVAADEGAHALYLRGKIEWNRRSRAGLERAVVLFRSAIEQDPTSAEAFAGLAEAYVMLGYHGYLGPDAAFPKGKAAALRSIALDSTRGDAYAALGVALQGERRWGEAEQAFQTAIRNAPDYATAHQWFALLATILGRTDEAVVHGRRAAELDPLSIQVNNTYGVMLYNAGMLDSALAVYRRIVTEEPDTAWVQQNPWVFSNFAMVASKAGSHDQALAMVDRALASVPGHPRLALDLVRIHLDRGDVAKARQAFSVGDPEHPHYGIYKALVEAETGDLDSAFDAFRQVREWSLPFLISVSGPGAIRSLRDDPRYPALRRHIGLPEDPEIRTSSLPRREWRSQE
jgi:DNA-binding SARP family transcriptional activator/Tfp pilus assembly protein PilF